MDGPGSVLRGEIEVKICGFTSNAAALIDDHPIAQVNDLIEHLLDSKARYRVVLDM